MQVMKKVNEPAKPARTVEVHSHTECDLCKGDDCEFDNGEVTFNYVDGDDLECGSGIMFSYDICDKCFIGALIPLLREMGAVPTQRKWG